MTISDKGFIYLKQFKVRILKSGKDTNGECDLLEYEYYPKEANSPAHYHKEFTENYTVLKGMMILQLEKDFKLLTEGDSFLVHRNVVHSFFNHTSERVRFLVEIRPSSEAYIKALIIRQGLMKDGLCNKKGVPKKFSHQIILTNLSKSFVSGFGGFIQRIFQFLAKKQTYKNIESQLVKKYYDPYY